MRNDAFHCAATGISCDTSYEQSYPVMECSAGYGAGGYGGGGYGGSAIPAVKKKYKILRLIAV